MTDSTIRDRRTAEHSDLTASQRSQRARIAAQARWAQQDGSQGTQAARDAFMARFYTEVDPDNRLPVEERERRAMAARRLYFQRMAFARSRKRRERGQETAPAERVVYFLRRGELVKIGTTSDLTRRVKSFQHRLEDVVATVPGGYDVERLWHDRFGHLRVPAEECGGTEWFRAEAELMDAITAAAGAAHGKAS